MKKYYMSQMILPLTMVSLAIMFPSCSSEDKIEAPQDRTEIVLDEATRAAASELNSFYVKFTTDAARYADDKYEGSQNIVVSPLSASMLLSMLANGVEKEERQEIAAYLGIGDIDAVNSLSRRLIDELPKADRTTELRLANSVWVSDEHKLNGAFSSRVQSDYMAQVCYENFRTGLDKTLQKINRWSSTHTNGLIPEVTDQVKQGCRVILLNSMYFNGEWDEKYFSKEDTGRDVFHGVNGDAEVDMMHSSKHNIYYNRTDDFEIFTLAFGNCSYLIKFVVPDERLSLSEANELLTSETLDQLSEDAVNVWLDVYLPKFEVNRALWLNDIFDEGKLPIANREIMLEMLDPAMSGLMDFYQVTSFRIDEKGVEAAATTVGNDVNLAPEIKPGESYTVKVDRPFYFFIKEFSTGAWVLSGRITDL